MKEGSFLDRVTMKQVIIIVVSIIVIAMFGSMLGIVVSRIDSEKTTIEERLIKLELGHPDKNVLELVNTMASMRVRMAELTIMVEELKIAIKELDPGSI